MKNKTFITILLFAITLAFNNLIASECYKCHQSFKERYNKKFIHSPVKDDECEECHEKHDKRNVLILKGSISEICAYCHDYEEDFKASHKNIYITKDSCLLCHNPHASDNEKLIYGYEHTPFKEKKCTACHKENTDRVELNFEEKDICRTCHRDKQTGDKEMKYHIPFLMGKCLKCHSPHTSKYENHLKNDTKSICIEQCHKSIREDKNPHEPVKERKCLLCHSPHKSPNKNLIKISGNKKMSALNDLCKNCHKNILTEKYIHLIAMTGECDICHKNHKTKNDNLLEKPGKEGCYRDCHDSKERNSFIHKPIVEGSCTDCHNPHSASNEKLLLTEDNKKMVEIGQLCYRCHKKFESKVGIHKLVAQRKCDVCHNEIHSSKNSKFLKNEVRALCISCHKEKSKKSNHNTDRVCTDCHDPHYPKQ